ncbi:MAG: hypothetical protein LBF61_06785, partial [Azoarcus sp.]|nr:hypothetical protein [Azoarcus sp.]
MTTRQNMRMCFPTSGGLWRFLKNLLPLFFLPLVWVVLFSFFLPLLLPLWILAARVTYDLTRQHDEVLIENALLGMEVGAVLKLADVGIDPAES